MFDGHLRKLHGLLVLVTLVSTLSPRAATGQALELVTVEAATPDSVTAERASRVAISSDGRSVAFCSTAIPGDLVPGKVVPAGSTGTSNVYVRDLVTRTTAILTLSATDPSVTGNGTCAPDVQITPDGRFVGFKSTATNLLSSTWTYAAGSASGWVYDRQTGVLALVDVAVQPFYAAGLREMVMSENGRFVAFSSAGSGSLTQLVPNFIDDNGSLLDLYVRDLQSNTTRLVSRQYTDPKRGAPAGVETSTGESPRVFSADGTSLLFAGAFAQLIPNGSTARNLYVYRWSADAIALVSATTGESAILSGATVDVAGNPAAVSFSITADGRFAAFTASTTQGELTGAVTNRRKNVYVRDLRTAVAPTTIVSLTTSGLGGNGDSTTPVISRNGAIVAFESIATDLVDNITDSASLPDIFARPMSGPNRAGPVEWLTRDAVVPAGGNKSAALEDVSADGRYVAWRSAATNYVIVSVVSDLNNADDVFVRDRAAGTVNIKSVVPIAAPATADAASGSATLLSAGQAAFFSDATNLLVTPPTSGTNIFAPVPSFADLSVSIADAPDPALVGQQLIYTFTVANLGPAAATGVALIVPVPDGGTVLSAEGGLTPSGGVVRFTLGTLGVGQTVTRTMSVIYGAARVATVTATVSATQADPVAPNNSAVQTTNIATLSITGTVRDAGGAGLPNVTVTLTGSAFDTTTTAADGSYTLGNLAMGGNFTVTPSATGYAFTPVSTPVANLTTDRSADFTAVCAPAISGLVRDRLDGALAGVTVMLSGSGDATAVTDVNGRYTFNGVSLGQSFTIVPTRPGFTFDVPSVSVTTATCGTTPDTLVATSGVFTRYFAEGATSTFFDTSIALLNASGTPTSVHFTFQTGRADDSDLVHDITLSGFQRATIDPKTIAGLEMAEFSTVVSSDQPVIADRTMHWDASGYGSHAETSIAEPRTSWYLAEGATTGGFQLFYLLQNPNDSAADVQVTYLLPTPAQPFTKTYTVLPGTRQNIWVNVEDARLAHAEVSAVFASSLPVIVERAMYLDRPGQTFAAGHEAAAVPGPATQWFFAEGATGPYFDLFYLMANPGTTAAVIDGRYLLPDGTVLTKQYTVAPQSRFNVWADYETFQGRPGLPLGNTDVSATFTSANGVGFVAERAMWWPGDGSQWFEGHDSAGALLSGTKWGLADGDVGGTLGTETYILIANTSNTDGTVQVTIVYEDGSTSVLTRPIKANSRTNVAVGVDVPAAANRRFGAVVESLGSNPVQIVVERAMYNNAGGVTWAAGSNNLGIRLR
ncbi:hypothetical protein LuPra_01650 [Luteitalea pratensis]|uniref:DUF11 domain-containing protein n=1 Tax=Luteitalea pratensis TaxID=1855912 RepID=A0A143PJM7_LUTPR|nr:hypothetical protein LuPra_01650 [Luteitalea pratensis]